MHHFRSDGKLRGILSHWRGMWLQRELENELKESQKTLKTPKIPISNKGLLMDACLLASSEKVSSEMKMSVMIESAKGKRSATKK